MREFGIGDRHSFFRHSLCASVLPCLLIGFLVPLQLSAKRVRPKAVAPVTFNGITYSADGDGKNGYVVATEASSGKELWRLHLYKIHIKPGRKKTTSGFTSRTWKSPKMYYLSEMNEPIVTG